MCGRFTLTTPLETLSQAIPRLGLPTGYRPRYNIAPTQQVLALRQREDGPEACWLRWGLVPFWAKDPSIGNRMINARAETVASKPAFRAAYRLRRCAVLADGFYEWVKQGGAKVPMHIRLEDGRPFALAGLWERWVPAEGEPLVTCTLITTTASPALAAIHHRMPVILDDDGRDRWLDPDATADARAGLLVPYDGPDLVFRAVSTRVNSPANDGPDCLE